MERKDADVMKKMQYILNMRPVLNTEALFSDGSDYYRCPSSPESRRFCAHPLPYSA